MTAEDGEGRFSSVLAQRIDLGARSRLEVREIGSVPFVEAQLPGPFRVVFTTRLGGVSGGSFASLNLDPSSADEAAAVRLNRERMALILGETEAGSRIGAGAGSGAGAGPTYRLVSPAQAHGVRVLGTAEYARDLAGAPCDGLTVQPVLDQGLAALLLFADCVPIILVGEVDMAVAHGGWRGILGGVVQQAGRAMIGPPAAAVIGPSIGPCCFTVGEEVARAFAARFGPEVVAETCHVDLWAAATRALGELGVTEGQVVNPRLCTACNADFFYSYRREGPMTGRHGCMAWTVPV